MAAGWGRGGGAVASSSLKEVSVGKQSHVIVGWKEEAAIASFCEHWSCLDQRQALPSLSLTSRKGLATPMDLRHWCLWHGYAHVNNTHLFRILSTLYEFIQSFLSYLHILLLFKNAIILWLHQGINKFISGQRPHKLFVSGNTITDRYRGCEYSSRGLPIQLQITLEPTLVRHSIGLDKHIMAYVYIYSIIAKHFPHDLLICPSPWITVNHWPFNISIVSSVAECHRVGTIKSFLFIKWLSHHCVFFLCVDACFITGRVLCLSSLSWSRHYEQGGESWFKINKSPREGRSRL